MTGRKPRRLRGGTVSAVSPFKIVTDDSTVAIPAVNGTAHAPVVGQRVLWDSWDGVIVVSTFLALVGGIWVNAADTGWLNLTGLVAGWAVPAGGHVAQVRTKHGVTYMRGYLQNSAFTGGPTTVATIPAAIILPTGDQLDIALGGNSTTSRSAEITAGSTALKFFTSAATASFYPLSSIFWLTD